MCEIAKHLKRTLCNTRIDIHYAMCYNILVRSRGQTPLKRESEVMETGMTNAEFNAFLETLAQLVESKAETVKESSDIIRNAKTE